MKWHLFSLCFSVSADGVERGSEWIDDEWLASELARDPDLDRTVDLPEFDLRKPSPLTGTRIPWPSKPDPTQHHLIDHPQDSPKLEKNNTRTKRLFPRRAT